MSDVRDIIDDEFYEPTVKTFKTWLEMPDRDLDVIVHFSSMPTERGDDDYHSGRLRHKIEDVTKEEDGESVMGQLTQDQLDFLLDRVYEYAR